MPDDRSGLQGEERLRAGVMGEPLRASVSEILDEKQETDTELEEQRAAGQQEREQAEARKAREHDEVMKHTGGEHRVRRSRGPREGERMNEQTSGGGMGGGMDEVRSRAQEAARRARPAIEHAEGRAKEWMAKAQDAGIDPKWVAGAAIAGFLLGGGIRKLLVLGALAGGGWALYKRYTEAEAY